VPDAAENPGIDRARQLPRSACARRRPPADPWLTLHRPFVPATAWSRVRHQRLVGGRSPDERGGGPSSSRGAPRIPGLPGFGQQLSIDRCSWGAAPFRARRTRPLPARAVSL